MSRRLLHQAQAGSTVNHRFKSCQATRIARSPISIARSGNDTVPLPPPTILSISYSRIITGYHIETCTFGENLSFPGLQHVLSWVMNPPYCFLLRSIRPGVLVLEPAHLQKSQNPRISGVQIDEAEKQKFTKPKRTVSRYFGTYRDFNGIFNIKW